MKCSDETLDRKNKIIKILMGVMDIGYMSN